MQSGVAVPSLSGAPLNAAQLALAARALGASGAGAGVTHLMALLCNAGSVDRATQVTGFTASAWEPPAALVTAAAPTERGYP